DVRVLSCDVGGIEHAAKPLAGFAAVEAIEDQAPVEVGDLLLEGGEARPVVRRAVDGQRADTEAREQAGSGGEPAGATAETEEIAQAFEWSAASSVLQLAVETLPQARRGFVRVRFGEGVPQRALGGVFEFVRYAKRCSFSHRRVLRTCSYRWCSGGPSRDACVRARCRRCRRAPGPVPRRFRTQNGRAR